MLPIAAHNTASFTKKWQKRRVKATYVRKNAGDGLARSHMRTDFPDAVSLAPPDRPHSVRGRGKPSPDWCVYRSCIHLTPRRCNQPRAAERRIGETIAFPAAAHRFAGKISSMVLKSAARIGNIGARTTRRSSPPQLKRFLTSLWQSPGPGKQFTIMHVGRLGAASVIISPAN